MSCSNSVRKSSKSTLGLLFRTYMYLNSLVNVCPRCKSNLWSYVSHLQIKTQIGGRGCCGSRTHSTQQWSITATPSQGPLTKWRIRSQIELFLIKTTTSRLFCRLHSVTLYTVASYLRSMINKSALTCLCACLAWNEEKHTLYIYHATGWHTHKTQQRVIELSQAMFKKSKFQISLPLSPRSTESKQTYWWCYRAS